MDAPEDVQDHGIVGLRAELQAAGPGWHAVFRCPPVAVTLDKQGQAGCLDRCDACLGCLRDGRRIAPAGGKPEGVLGAQWRGAQQSRRCGRVGEVEPVQDHWRVVFGSCPPGRAGDHCRAAQCYPRPFGAVLAAGGPVAVADAEGAGADQGRSGKGFEQWFLARGQRADDQVGHADVLPGSSALPGQVLGTLRARGKRVDIVLATAPTSFAVLRVQAQDIDGAGRLATETSPPVAWASWRMRSSRMAWAEMPRRWVIQSAFAVPVRVAFWRLMNRWGRRRTAGAPWRPWRACGRPPPRARGSAGPPDCIPALSR